MMGIEVPETCRAYHKCNKAFSDIYLVFLLYVTVNLFLSKTFRGENSRLSQQFFICRKVLLQHVSAIYKEPLSGNLGTKEKLLCTTPHILH